MTIEFFIELVLHDTHFSVTGKRPSHLTEIWYVIRSHFIIFRYSIMRHAVKQISNALFLSL